MIRIDFDRYTAADARNQAALAEIKRLRTEAQPHHKAAQEAGYILDDRQKLRGKLEKAVVCVKRGDTVATGAGDSVVAGHSLSLYVVAGGLADGIGGSSWGGKSRVKAEDGGWTFTRSGGKLRRVTLEELEAALAGLGSAP